MQAHKIQVPKTAHYYTLGKPSKQIKRLWIATHGYGQLAQSIIRKFEDIVDEETFILAPEGMSRFYWKGFFGEVGASWMTKADRLDEIADYANYMQLLYDQFVPQLNEEVQINLLGFSQGCATHCRWIMELFPHYHNLILWGGLLPEDLDYTPHETYFSNKKLYWVYGEHDPFLSRKRVEWHEGFAKEQLFDLQITTFDGKHEINREVLKKLSHDL